MEGTPPCSFTIGNFRAPVVGTLHKCCVKMLVLSVPGRDKSKETYVKCLGAL